MNEEINLLIDFGSTYTKVVAVDLEKVEVVAQSRAPSTVDTDITIGLREALEKIKQEIGSSDLREKKALACSSAAGGLRMVCTGFVTEYTSEAANLAALGAGAKVVGRFSYELEEKEIEEIDNIAPDIFLLTGGTDGGNSRVIIHNARMLAKTSDKVKNIIVAGNKSAYGEIRKILAFTGKNVIFTRNVMPEIGKLDLIPCNKEIRELFLKNIIEAKGLTKAKAFIRDIIMPTPSAVLEAAKIISSGYGDTPGLGELVIVDTGGSTTDVHSIASGNPQRADIIMMGLPEPYEKRTVEGDLGLKYNLDTLMELMKDRSLPLHFCEAVDLFREGKLPETTMEFSYQKILSYLVVETAVNRHAGIIEETYGPAGRIFIQRGKDLTGAGYVIGTGGVMAYINNPREILEAALFSEQNPYRLKPRNPELLIDKNYILYAVGLLSQTEPEKALKLAKKYLKKAPSHLLMSG
jgi:uncharacterized protein (TIGR01319 family)